MTLDELARRMRELGRPVLKSGLSKLEAGERRVDVDDLVALAIALETNTNALLLDPEADSEPIRLTEQYEAQRIAAWLWACGELSDGAGPWPWARFYPEAPAGMAPNGLRFESEARPHDPPRRLSVEEWDELQPWRVERDKLLFAMLDAGLPKWMFEHLMRGARTYLAKRMEEGGDRGEHQ